MNAHRPLAGLCISSFLLVASSAAGLANRVFVSARSGNNANSCDNILTPCQTFAGAVLQLNPGGEAIVLDSGGYGPVTITHGVTIEAPPGVTAFIHPPSGNAITVNASGATVTLRGLVLNGGTSGGIEVQAVGTLSIENCFITGFSGSGIHIGVGGNLNIKSTDLKACGTGIFINNTSGLVIATIDHCHLDSNTYGFFTQTIGSGLMAATTATHSTANGNSQDGWHSGANTSGEEQLFLEFCSASGNGNDGVINAAGNISSQVVISNCAFANNLFLDVEDQGPMGQINSRGNNTYGSESGIIGPFPSN